MPASRHYDLLAALPHLGELGDETPLTTAQFLARVAEADGPAQCVEALLLADDLLQHEALLAGEIEQAEPAVLTQAQVRDEAPLPEALRGRAGDQGSQRVAADAVWEAYFRHVVDVAASCHGRLLAAWAGYEVALRNTLADERARALGLPPEGYFVAPDLADEDANLSAVVAEWSAARDPVAALHAVDRARWAWLADHEDWFGFGDDELIVYAARLMLMQRRRR